MDTLLIPTLILVSLVVGWPFLTSAYKKWKVREAHHHEHDDDHDHHHSKFGGLKTVATTVAIIFAAAYAIILVMSWRDKHKPEFSPTQMYWHYDQYEDVGNGEYSWKGDSSTVSVTRFREDSFAFEYGEGTDLTTFTVTNANADPAPYGTWEYRGKEGKWRLVTKLDPTNPSGKIRLKLWKRGLDPATDPNPDVMELQMTNRVRIR